MQFLHIASLEDLEHENSDKWQEVCTTTTDFNEDESDQYAQEAMRQMVFDSPVWVKPQTRSEYPIGFRLPSVSKATNT